MTVRLTSLGNPAHANSGPSSPSGSRDAAQALAECEHLDRVAAIAYRPLRSQARKGLPPEQVQRLLVQMMQARIEQHGSYSGDNNQLSSGNLLRRMPEWEAQYGAGLLAHVESLDIPEPPATRLSMNDSEVTAGPDTLT